MTPTVATRVVVWDLDDVIVNFAETLCERMTTRDGLPADWRQWHTYDTCQTVFAPTHDGFVDAMIQARVLESCEPIPGVLATIADFHARGWTQFIVTARGWHPDGVNITAATLAHHQIAPYIAAVHVVNGGKVDALSRIGRVDLYVEDCAHHVAAALDQCDVAEVAMINRPWNLGFQPSSPNAHSRLRRIESPHQLLFQSFARHLPPLAAVRAE